MTLPVKPEFISSSKRIHHRSHIVLLALGHKGDGNLPDLCSSMRAANISLIKNEVSREKIGSALSAIDKIDHGSKIASVHNTATNDISVTHLRLSKCDSDDEQT